MARVSLLGRMPTVSLRTVRRLALASLVANIAIVGTGAAVRLTESGLGCPTWPRCTDASYRPTSEMGMHGAIEFGNRLLTFAVGIAAVLALVAALRHLPRRRDLIVPGVLVLFGIPAQAVIGGFTVLTNLNPWVVGLHFLASMGVIAAAQVMWWRTLPCSPAAPLPGPMRLLAWLATAASAAVVVVGVIVTGSGPHSGDQGAKRNGLDPETISQVHADLVFLLIGLSVALCLALLAVNAPRVAVKAAFALVAVELAQGLIGFVQYFTHLPEALVGAHVLGAAIVWAVTLAALSAATAQPATINSPTEPLLADTPVPASAAR